MSNFESPGYDDTNEILVKMRMGVSFRWPIRIRDFQITVRPLTMAETLEVLGNVAAELKRQPDIYRNRIQENALIAKEHLIYASSTQPGANDFRLTHKLLNDMTIDEVLAIHKEYLSVVDKGDPAIEAMPAEELSRLVNALKKTSHEEPDSQLTELSFWQLKQVAVYLLRQSD